MKQRIVTSLAVSLGLVAGSFVVAGPAVADHHLVSISEVFPGTTASPGIEAVELKAYSPGQNLLSGHWLWVYSADGTSIARHQLSGANPTNGASQASYLLMTAGGQQYFGVAPDFQIPALSLDPAAGKLCFATSQLTTPIDCVSWGAYTGLPGVGEENSGTPASAGGITDGTSLVRDEKLTAGLQASDDTDDSATDFDEAQPRPKNSDNFTGNAAGRIGFKFSSYSVDEGVPNAEVVLNRFGTGVAASVTVNTTDGTATAADYTDTEDVIVGFAAGEAEKTFSFPVTDDALEEGDETVTVTLSAPTNGAVLRDPVSNEVTISDNDGPSIFTFDKSSYSGFEGNTVVITVRRDGNVNVDASVVFEMSNGTAGSGDYDGGPFQQTLNFAGGPDQDDVTTFAIHQPLTPDTKVEPNETVNLELSNPSSNAELGTPSTAVLTIRNDSTKPKSRVTRPEHGTTYRRGTLRDLRGVASDGGSGVARVQVALRRNMTNGSCKWWTGSRWRTRSCTQKLFLNASGRETWKELLGKLLPRSKGTTTRNYTAYSRAIDRAGNRESRFVRGRNANTFEVR